MFPVTGGIWQRTWGFIFINQPFNYTDMMTQQPALMVAEDSVTYGTKKDDE